MPNNLSGIELTRQIMGEYKYIKALLTSGYPDEIVDMVDIMEMDVELLTKSYRRTQLASAIEKVVSAQRKH
jgi:pyruvate/2-oxoglutarate/acetoin dehydrogenase E1 component